MKQTTSRYKSLLIRYEQHAAVTELFSEVASIARDEARSAGAPYHEVANASRKAMEPLRRLNRFRKRLCDHHLAYMGDSREDVLAYNDKTDRLVQAIRGMLNPDHHLTQPYVRECTHIRLGRV